MTPDGRPEEPGLDKPLDRLHLYLGWSVALFLIAGAVSAATFSRDHIEFWFTFTVFVAAPLACNLVFAIIAWLFLRGGAAGGVVGCLLIVALVGGLMLLLSGQLRF